MKINGIRYEYFNGHYRPVNTTKGVIDSINKELKDELIKAIKGAKN